MREDSVFRISEQGCEESQRQEGSQQCLIIVAGTVDGSGGSIKSLVVENGFELEKLGLLFFSKMVQVARQRIRIGTAAGHLVYFGS